jgi:intracellular multiplication protein IcmL
MAETEHVVVLRDDFYRDHFGKVLFIIASVCIAIVLLIAASIYLHLNKPEPVSFAVLDEWRVQPPIPLDQPYLATPDLLQWVSDALPKAFNYDFNHYNGQLQQASQYFTKDGWKIFLNQLNIYVNYNNVQNDKMFVNGSAAGAPFILNQGLLSGRYAWWVQMPVDVSYANYNRSARRSLTLQVLVVRVSTLNNLNGIGIDNVIVSKSTGTSL